MGRVVAIVTAASTSRESARAGCGVGTGLAGEGAEAVGAGTNGEIVTRPR